jgi:hypothetical protein
MAKNYYTESEIVMCAYIALHGRALLNEKKIASLGKRSEDSIKMKVQNIAAMLDEKGIQRNPDVPALSGKPPGESGRETDWEIVGELVTLTKKELLAKCTAILREQ